DTVSTSAPAGGQAVAVVTNALGQTTQRREYGGPTPTGTDFTTTSYTYTPAGQQKAITGPGDSSTWSYGYDLFGRQISAKDPDKGTTSTTYDALDRVDYTTDAENNKLLYGYDELNRTTGLWQTDKTNTNKLAAWTFDTLAAGQQDKATRYEGGTTGKAYTSEVTSYDSLYQVTGSQLTLPDTDPLVTAGVPKTLSFSTGYRLDGTISQASQPAVAGLASETVSYTYNATGQQLTSGGTTGYLQGALYSPQGDLRQLTLGMDGSSSAKKAYLNYDYEAGTRRLTRSYVTDDTHNYVPQELKFTQDDAGNVTSIFDTATLDGTAEPDYQCFTYDGQRRLSESWTAKTADCATSGRTTANLDGAAPYWTSYTYNEAGQRKTETEHASSGSTTTNYEYGTTVGQPHPLTRTTGPKTNTYDYDKNGNTKSRPGTSAQQTLDWNSEGKLAKTTEGAAETSYLYGAGGELLIRRAKGDGDTILYLGGTEVRLTVKGTAKTLTGTRYYDGAGQTIAVRTAVSGASGTKLSFLAADHHGTSSLALDATTYAITKRYTSPFGETRGTKPTAWPDDKAFLGKPADSDTGLTHIGAREYDPGIGQFISADPLLTLDQHQSLNGYSYANQHPTTTSDPTGLQDADCASRVATKCSGGVPTSDSGMDVSKENTLCSPGMYCWDLGGTAPVDSSGNTGNTGPTCYYAMGMNSCSGGTSAGPADIDSNSGNYDTHGYTGGYPVAPDLVGESGDPALLKELGLMGCGWIPVVGSGCDMYDLKRSRNEGDTAGVVLGIAGFVPLFGDLAKFPHQLKRLDDLLEAAEKSAKGAGKAGKVARSLSDPESLRGATAGELNKLLVGVERKPSHSATGGGFMVRIPGGAMVFEAGNSAMKDGQYVMRDPLHRGPYVKVQQGKSVTRIPLAGNPTLD
ncbi:RHS repeat-associated core domain-containing protein, partial [Streptomyces sp. NPDC057717]|uniref:RHS repeat-associated core domain-containing protein n=1 Tax=Streptomyces sp. NPDC057717 TaxID=3346224 RepID=UPI0036CBF79A